MNGSKYTADKNWFIVDLSKPHQPKVFKVWFNTKSEALSAIKISLDNDRKNYMPIRASEVEDLGLPFYKRKRLIKYEYPPELFETQERKSFRTKLRRIRRGGKITQVKKRNKKKRDARKSRRRNTKE